MGYDQFRAAYSIYQYKKKLLFIFLNFDFWPAVDFCAREILHLPQLDVVLVLFTN